MRARWSYVLAGRPELGTAYSLESTLDEIVFVTGPLIATVIATRVTPVLVLYIATALVVGGAFWLYSRRDSAPPPRPQGQPAHRSAGLERGMPLLVLVAAAMGVALAGAEVTIVAFCGEHGRRGLSGAVLAAFAGGSALAGFLYGARTWRRPLLAAGPAAGRDLRPAAAAVPGSPARWGCSRSARSWWGSASPRP